MSKRKLILLVAAGFVGLLTILVVRSLLTPQEPQAVAEKPLETAEILAASRDLPIGTVLRESDMKWIPWPAEADVSQFYKKGRDETGKLTGGVLREGLRNGEPFLAGRVVQPHDHGFLAAVLSPGMRAMSMTLSPSSEVAGFIFPGDHVDVILTHSFSRKDVSDLTERRVSETVLRDVRVLALDQKSDSMSADPKVAQLATLEVTPKQAEKLALAQDLAGTTGGGGTHGSLSLVLRSLATEDQPQTTPQAAPQALAPIGADGADGATPEGIALPAQNLAAPPLATGDPESTTTWDSDVSPAFPGVGGTDSIMQRVHIMRGKESTDTSFERRK